MPHPRRYDNGVIRPVALNVAPPPGGYVEGTAWSFPPNVKEWEKAVGYNRPRKGEKESFDIPGLKTKHTKITVVINIEGVSSEVDMYIDFMASRTNT